MPRRSAVKKSPKLSDGAVSAEDLKQQFQKLKLPIQPPFPPMEAKLVDAIPEGALWQYEPKWDGFRCVAFRDGDTVELQSKAGQPLGRYFPEIVEALLKLKPTEFVLDGEIVILRNGHLSFDDLLMRIHPAASRIKKLSVETPATYLVFDLLVDDKAHSLVEETQAARRERLELFFKTFKGNASVRLSPMTRDHAEAEKWMKKLAVIGFDGVVAKALDQPYQSGERAMRKIKRIRTADCVVGGFRYASKGGEVGSLLLGVYNDEGQLDHIGFSSSFAREERKQLKKILKPYMNGEGFTGKAPGGPSRWSTERTGEWERLDPKLVCEVSYDHFSGGRFRHGTKFLRWRPEKEPKSCTYEQITPAKQRGSMDQFLAA
ncbi:ATP dependent DNA ligase [Candidatus Koribacter versatilis Ellin345]|uniref:DNA ligase (ATP) n=1 Tax=Koribacter versatilis (strain Ellin345) TaxID=204669 RepID=Q1IL20_KORVE|nr:ATP-dependent DNA ligase [Candidatus Koribacter versatilis]ABF42430.1 ATP dependent DNA ligase [Candidatus Koribacter versatilis Ellin345]